MDAVADSIIVTSEDAVLEITNVKRPSRWQGVEQGGTSTEVVPVYKQ
jgi:hypothetical protein